MKEPWYFQTTSAKWAAAQARGYLLETTVTPQSSNPVLREAGTTQWTQLAKSYMPSIFQSASPPTVANVLLKVMYERKSTDFVSFDPGVGATICATGQIPLEDVEVISTSMFGGGGSESGS